MIPSLTIRLLGSPQTLIDDRPVETFPSAKVSALLYILAASARPRSRETLAGLIWPDYDPAQAKKNLRGALYHLRKALDPYIDVQRQEIGLNADRTISVDVVAFEAALERARREPEKSPAQQAELTAAVTAYRGPFLEGFSLADSDLFEEWAATERRRLHELAIQALNRLVTVSIEGGAVLQGIEYATQLLALDPLREESQHDLMLLLALDGQTRAALTRYDDFTARLAAELDVPPSPELEALAQRIRSGEFDNAAAVRVVTPQPRLHNLPAETLPILDRDQEEAAILKLLADPDVRLITLVGLGGTGKTRLAIHVGHQLTATLGQENAAPPAARFPDGVFLIDLAGLEASGHVEAQIAAAIAQALHFNLDTIDAAHVAAALAERRMLLLLDNFELLQSAAGFLTTLLARAPGLCLLVTSRIRLKLRGEQVILLDGLPTPSDDDEALHLYPATALFLRAAEPRAGDAALASEEAHAIAAACRLLHGLPLGIELAAAWTPLLSPNEILQEIRQGIDFLQSDMPDLPERHRSLRAVFERTWRNLAEEERTVMARLAIFRGGFTRRAAEDVAGASLLTLRQLLDKALIRYVASDEDAGKGRGRYDLAEVLRQYALTHLDDPVRYRSTRSRHARFYFEFLADLHQPLRSGDQPAALDAIALEIDNIRTALAWLSENEVPPEGMTLARFRLGALALFDAFDMRGWFAEGDAVFAALVAQIAQQGNDAEILAAELQARQAWFAFLLGRTDDGFTALTDSLTTLDRSGAKEAAIFNRNYLGAMQLHLSALGDAWATLDAAYAAAVECDDDYGASIALNTQGQVALRRGETDRARMICEEALALKRTVNDRRGMIYALTTLGRLAIEDGRHEEARRLFGESLQISEALEDLRGVGLAQRNLGDLAFQREEFGFAQRMYEASLANLRATGSRAETATGLIRIGATASARQELQTAAITLQEAFGIALDMEAPTTLAAGLAAAADLLAQMGEAERSAALLDALWPDERQDGGQTAHMSQQELVAASPASTKMSELEHLARRTLGYLASYARQ